MPSPSASTGSTQDFSERRSLSRADCLYLLAPGGHGRVAATMHAVPVIIPVSYALFGEDVVFTPRGGEGAWRAVADSVVAFGAGHVGSDGRSLWDVQVTGVARTLARQGNAPGFRLSSEIIAGWRAPG